jgi:hypothetical protein
LLVANGTARRLLTFGEFEDLYLKTYESDESDTNRQKILGVAANPLYGFTPFDRPVFWRLIMAQAYLHHALSRPVPSKPLRMLESREQLREYLNELDSSRFNWTELEENSLARSGETLPLRECFMSRWACGADQHRVGDAQQIALEFLVKHLVPLRHNGPSRSCAHTGLPAGRTNRGSVCSRSGLQQNRSNADPG